MFAISAFMLKRCAHSLCDEIIRNRIDERMQKVACDDFDMDGALLGNDDYPITALSDSYAGPGMV
jgi:hypothetical protein